MFRLRHSLPVLLAGCMLALTFAGYKPSRAAIFIVNSLSDTNGYYPYGFCEGNGTPVPGHECTLRAAITEARNGGGGAIVFNVSGTIKLASTLQVGPNGGDISIKCASQNITIDGGGQFQVMNVLTTLSLHNLTIQNGYSPLDGGAILYDGELTIVNCTFIGNSAGHNGGAIANKRTDDFNVIGYNVTLQVRNSTFVNNSAGDSGGAIYEIFQDPGTNTHVTGRVVIGNSTIVHNSAGKAGGGVVNQPYGLTARSTGGCLSCYILQFNYSRMFMFSSIVAQNTDTNGTPDVYAYPEIGGNIVSLGHNLIGNGAGSGSGFCQTLIPAPVYSDPNCTDNGGGSDNPLDPLLGPLANNPANPLPMRNTYAVGIKTLALLPRSPAIGMGDCRAQPAVKDPQPTAWPEPVFMVTTDERGAIRKSFGLGCDIGAFDQGASFLDF